MISIGSALHTVCASLSGASDVDYWSGRIKADTGLDMVAKPGTPDSTLIFRQMFQILRYFTKDLIRDCGINKVIIRTDMGPNRTYYPNHGYYCDNFVALNADIFYHPDQPDDFFDHRGYFITRPEQTILHEFGHGYDDNNGSLSHRDAWTSLSGWSKSFKPGLERLVIDEPGAPRVVGEWYFDPKIGGFTRFYAKRNPWDDFADSFSFYLAGMKNKLPENKARYFDGLLSKYFK